MRISLMCTFTHRSNLDLVIDYINKVYNPPIIYVQQNIHNLDSLYCTFTNVNGVAELTPSTISIHRKKQTNTLYTINALNNLIKDINNGILDKTFELDWENYKDSYLLSNEGYVDVVPIRLLTKIQNYTLPTY